MYPHIVTYIPGQEKRPVNAGQYLGSLTYPMPGGTVKAAVHVAGDSCIDKARQEYQTIVNNGLRAAGRG